jgi:hypothetical protein
MKSGLEEIQKYYTTKPEPMLPPKSNALPKIFIWFKMPQMHSIV